MSVQGHVISIARTVTRHTANERRYVHNHRTARRRTPAKQEEVIDNNVSFGMRIGPPNFTALALGYARSKCGL